MSKKVIGYEQHLVRQLDALGRIKERVGHFPIYERLEEPEFTTFDMESPTFEPAEKRDFWRFGNGRERTG